jgi:hypothetical protein
LVLIPPPGPHDGFRTWYSVTYEVINTSFNNLEDMFVPGPIDHRFDLSTAQSPVSVATADLDGDGLADLVTANQSANSITIRFGQAPQFCEQAGFGPPHDVPVGQGPRAVAIGDLDLDGLPDVVVANGADQSISVLRGLGHGSFAAAVTTPLSGAPVSLSLGDLNSDGALDVAVAIPNPPSIDMLFGDGQGGVAPPSSVPGTLVSSVTPDAVVVFDLDNDRKMDIVIASASGQAGRWMGTGEGAFGSQSTFVAGAGARALAIGDITGDFKADLVVANGVDNTVSVWSGRGLNGNGTFRSLGTFPVGKGPASVSLIDIDANNHPDVAVANAAGGDVTLLYSTSVNDSTATFATPLTLPVGGQPVSILTGDFNREGALDLAVADSSGNSVNITFGPSNRNHKGANVANDVYEPTSDPNAPPDSQFFAHPTAPTAGVSSNLSRVGVVPNPYRAVEAWDPEGGHELHFINLPREARILIYTVSGDLVKEIHHSVPPYTPGEPQPPSGPPYDQTRDYEAWDLKNGAGKDVVSGIYIYRVEASSFQFQSRFIVIR